MLSMTSLFLTVLPLLNHFIQLCVLVPFHAIDSYIAINYCCYDFWLATKQIFVGDETTHNRDHTQHIAYNIGSGYAYMSHTFRPVF